MGKPNHLIKSELTKLLQLPLSIMVRTRQILNLEKHVEQILALDFLLILMFHFRSQHTLHKKTRKVLCRSNRINCLTLIILRICNNISCKNNGVVQGRVAVMMAGGLPTSTKAASSATRALPLAGLRARQRCGRREAVGSAARHCIGRSAYPLRASIKATASLSFVARSL